jgi:hypothetical protein
MELYNTTVYPAMAVGWLSTVQYSGILHTVPIILVEKSCPDKEQPSEHSIYRALRVAQYPYLCLYLYGDGVRGEGHQWASCCCCC